MCMQKDRTDLDCFLMDTKIGSESGINILSKIMWTINKQLNLPTKTGIKITRAHDSSLVRVKKEINLFIL